MPTQPMIVLGLAAALAVAACSGGDERPPAAAHGASGGNGGSGGSGALGGSAGSGAAADAGPDADASPDHAVDGGGTGGSGEDGGPLDGGPEPDPDAGTCGNGVIEPGEGCEGNDLGGKSCQSFGFDEGSPVCVACALDIRSCTGSERCGNGRDDDGDGDSDCNDDDCAGPCADPCADPDLLPDPSTTRSSTAGHASTTAPTCLSNAASTGEVVYRVNVETSGVLDVKLTSSADLSLSIRSACESAASERGCSESAAGSNGVERVVVPIARGDTVFLVVDGSGELGTFTLDVQSRPLECGDGRRDLDEECDDGNTAPSDGCSPACLLEPTEIEPNGTPAAATRYSGAKAVGAIEPAGDADVYAVDVIAPNTDLRAEILDFGDGACEQNRLDSYLEILDTNGTTVLNGDDDRGPGYCSLALAWSLPIGRYYVRVTASGTTPTFAYQLVVRQ